MTDRIARDPGRGRAARSPPPTDTAALEDVRIQYLGPQGRAARTCCATSRRSRRRSAPPPARRPTRRARRSKRRSSSAPSSSPRGELEQRLERDRVDITLPATRPRSIGRLHLITQTRREIEDVFIGLGFNVAEGPEVETVYYNFDALNLALDAPLAADVATRSTSSRRRTSSIRARCCCACTPRRCRSARWSASLRRSTSSCPGRTYRPDNDATHTPQFHQIEGLAVDTDITLGDLQGTLLAFARAIFGEEREVRLRPHFFPFTEPSVEVDVSCFNCNQGCPPTAAAARCARARRGSRSWAPGWSTRTCSSTCGSTGYDPERVQGFAFGMGIERIAMLKHGVPDLRLLYDNDVRFLEQFG